MEGTLGQMVLKGHSSEGRNRKLRVGTVWEWRRSLKNGSDMLEKCQRTQKKHWGYLNSRTGGLSSRRLQVPITHSLMLKQEEMGLSLADISGPSLGVQDTQNSIQFFLALDYQDTLPFKQAGSILAFPTSLGHKVDLSEFPKQFQVSFMLSSIL